MAFLSISFFVFLSNYVTASITPGFILVVKEFRISLTKASYLLTFNILFLGIGVIAFSIFSAWPNGDMANAL